MNTQQMEVAVNGPDGATHLILCTGIAELRTLGSGTYTFWVGPQLSRRQFVGAIASGALSMIQRHEKSTADYADLELDAHLVLIDASYDNESGGVMVRAEVSSGAANSKLAISYHVSILAELPGF